MKGKFDYEYRQFPNDVIYDLRKRDCIINILITKRSRFVSFEQKLAEITSHTFHTCTLM